MRLGSSSRTWRVGSSSFNGVAFEGELHTANQHAIRRVWPDRCGQAVFAGTIPMLPERRRAVAEVMRQLRWSGVFDLQLIERDGRDHVIDLNPRFYVSMTLAVAAGLTLPAIWASLLLGLPVEQRGYRVGVRFRHERDDPRAIRSELRRGRLGAARDPLPRRRTSTRSSRSATPAPPCACSGRSSEPCEAGPRRSRSRTRRSRPARPAGRPRSSHAGAASAP